MLSITTFKEKFVTAEEAVKVIKSGDRVYIHSNCAAPQTLISAMTDRYTELKDVEIMHLVTFGNAPYAEPKYEGHFRHNSLFTGHNVRKAVNEGRADFTPVFLSEIPLLMESGDFPIDVCLLHLSPPDEHGYCSFGISNDCSKTAADVAKIVIAQINPHMPRVLGDNFIHISRLNYIIEVNEPVTEFRYSTKGCTDEELKVYGTIGKYIADMIEDGATLQMGIGVIPDAVLPYLSDKKDLGIHTEMFAENLIPLIESGVVNGRMKNILPNKVVSTFVLGGKEFFDYIHNNPIIEFRPVKFVNDPFNIARNDKMVSINSAIEVDLTGQVCADSIGSRNYSGFGGQTDFIRGATRSKGGKPIIAFASTAKNGTQSKITPFLRQGAGVTTTRGDVHYIITEYGVANLYGKTIRQRTKALIEISHPDFRDELEREAVKLGYL